jgi:hypothetical protein
MPGICRCGWCFGRAQPCFFWLLGFRGGVVKLCVCCHHGTCLSSTVKLDAENGMEARNWRLAMEVWVLRCRDSGLVMCVLEQQNWQVGAVAQEEFSVQTYRVKTQGLTFIGCAWQWSYWRHCFVSVDLLWGENLWSLIRAMMVLVHYSLFGGIAFGVDGFLVLLWWYLVRYYKELVTIAGLFFYVILLCFFGCVYPYCR